MFPFNIYVSLRYIQLSLGNRVATFLERFAISAICSFYGFLIVFIYLVLWCWGLDADLIVSVSEFTYLV